MSNSALMEPIASKSDAVVTATFNPLLCQDCQYLNDPSTTASHLGGYGSSGPKATLEELSQRLSCIVCQTVSKDVQTLRNSSRVLEDLPASRIFVRNNGPSYLEDQYHFTPNKRFDTRDPMKLLIRAIMNISILVSQETASELACESELASIEGPGGLDQELDTVLDDAEPDLNEFEEVRMTPQYCLVYSPGDRQELVCIEPWEVPYFDTSLLSSWVRDCESFHGDQCTSFSVSTPLSDDFRLINVRSTSVVKPKVLVRYVNLSYVWQHATSSSQLQLQKSNLDNLSKPGGLNCAELPAVIADTIALCRDIGEAYLWVDRLCIIQDDPESKHNQICGMDKIYRSAAFTVTAVSEGPGLPGYAGRPRKSSIWGPPRDCKHEGGGVNAHHMEQAINRSLWNQRGWTFQERILSRRCVFITDFQVIFKCSKGKAVEEFTWASQDLPKSQAATQAEEGNLDLRGWVGRNLEYGSVDYNTATPETMAKYCAWVWDYTSRKMTYDSDILNAFAGVGSYLSDSLGTQIIFGLPEKHIEKAILWGSSDPRQRRQSTPHIPSWSWASWKQSVGYGSPKLEDQVSLVYFYYQNPVIGLRKLTVEERWLQIEKRVEEFQDEISVPETSVCMPLTAGKYMLGHWRSTKTWQACPHSPWQTLTHKNPNAAACSIAPSLPGSLIFNTTVASLRLHLGEGDIGKNRPLTSREFAICAEDGERIGFVNTVARESQEYYDFIVICGALLISRPGRHW